MKYKLVIYLCLTLLLAGCNSNTKIAIKTVSGKNGTATYQLDYPVLTQKFKNKKIRDKLNKHFKQLFLDDQKCNSSRKITMHSTSTITDVMITKKLLSFKCHYDRFCGSAYPSGGVDYESFNLITGEPYDFLKTISDQKVFKKRVVDTFYISRPNFKKTDPRYDCTRFYTKQALSKAYYQYLPRKGSVEVRLNYPHVTRSCEYSVTL